MVIFIPFVIMDTDLPRHHNAVPVLEYVLLALIGSRDNRALNIRARSIGPRLSVAR
jgi:hypothetical protein